MYLVQVKTPAESKGPWDYCKILAAISDDQVFRTIEKSQCPLVKWNHDEAIKGNALSFREITSRFRNRRWSCA